MTQTKEMKMSSLRNYYEDAMEYFYEEAREYLRENCADGELYFAALTGNFNLFHDRYMDYKRDSATDSD